MIAVDTSVVVAAFASWHEGHQAASEVMAMGPRLPAHCALESYSVLTRLPPPHRVGGPLVRGFMRARFPEPWLVLDAPGQAELLDRLVDQAITGGAAYDGLVALTASCHSARLFSRDRRAAAAYGSLGIDFELI